MANEYDVNTVLEAIINLSGPGWVYYLSDETLCKAVGFGQRCLDWNIRSA